MTAWPVHRCAAAAPILYGSNDLHYLACMKKCQDKVKQKAIDQATTTAGQSDAVFDTS